MTITLPKDRQSLIGFRYNELIPFEMNSITLDTILPAIFRKAILDGHDAKSDRSSATAVGNTDRSIEELSRHQRLEGFDDESSRRMLRRLAQTLMFLPVKNQTTKELEIGGLIPYSLAPYVVVFPTNAAGFRQVDHLIYRMLLNQSHASLDSVKDLIKDTFGKGLNVGTFAEPSVARLETEELDALTELSVAYVQGFPALTPGRQGLRSYVAAKPLPDLQERSGRHLHRYLKSYADREPRTLLIDQIKTLIALQLSIMTIRLLHQIPDWERASRNSPEALQEISSLEIYLDFMADPRHLSRTIATRCTRRDLERLPIFVEAVFRLKYYKNIVDGVSKHGELRKYVLEELDGVEIDDTPNYIAAICRAITHPQLVAHVNARATLDLDAILAANKVKPLEETPDSNDEIKSDVDRLSEDLATQGLSPLDQVQHLLVQAQQRKANTNTLVWFRDVGRVDASDGLISGGVNRSTWAYAPSNELLTVLVQLCAIDYRGWKPEISSSLPRPFSVQHFLDWLHECFGIVIDRPPSGLGFQGPEYATASRDNLHAMLRKLRLMGMFEDQSDDFSVQQVVPPFMDIESQILKPQETVHD